MDVRIEDYTRPYLFGLVTVADSTEALIHCAKVLVQGKFKECDVSAEAKEAFMDYQIAEQILRNTYCSPEVLEVLATSKDDTVRHSLTTVYLPLEMINELIQDESFYVVYGLFVSKCCVITQANINDLVVRITNIDVDAIKEQDKVIGDELCELISYMLKKIELPQESVLALEEIRAQL